MQINCNSVHFKASLKPLSFALINARSLRNKTTTISDYILDNDFDVIAFTETWLAANNSDTVVINNICPVGYDLIHVPRGSRGGGVALMYRSSLDITLVTSQKKFKCFEHLHASLKHSSGEIQIHIVYRPPPNKKNGFTVQMFIAEMSDLLDASILEPSQFMMAGDFNFHMEDSGNTEALKFMDCLTTYDLQQHVSAGTHKSGHMLDLIITRSSDDCVLPNATSVDDILSPFDHHWVRCKVDISKPPLPTKVVKYRKWKSINTKLFTDDICQSELSNHNNTCPFALVESYNNVLAELLNKHAPIKQKEIVIHPKSPWYNADIAIAKRARRKAEKKWHKTKLTVHYELYVEAREYVNNLIDAAKSSHYRTKIADAKDHKSLFQVVDDLLHHKSSPKFPSCESDILLANKFNDYFAKKITKLREDLSSNPLDNDSSDTPLPAIKLSHELTELRPATVDEVRKVIIGSKSKTCKLDPIPTQLLKNCLEALLPTITELVNLTFDTSTMPLNLKKAFVMPLLKKPLLDSEIFKNYRPVSNLAFISKVVERIVAIRVREHMDINDLHENFQSAYKSLHSTETALLRVQDDILCALDNKKCVLLVLLDLSAAFDTIDHKVLINRLASQLGIKGKALDWFHSYLHQRIQSVIINGSESDIWELIFGIPQGSVLGPILFIIYTSPLGKILRKHNASYHLYADDSQLYLSFKMSEQEDAYSQMETCISEIRSWMSQNFLCLNDSKTEVIYIGSKASLKQKTHMSLTIGNELVQPSISARNIGVIMDESMSLQPHINNLCKSAWLHLRQIGMIRKHLDQASTERIIHAFVTSKLDYQNGLLYGLPACKIEKLQRIQNAAARVIARTKKFEHISPILKQLHWLPIHQRIVFKVLLFVFKALNNLAPIYLTELLEPLTHSRTLRSSTMNLLKCPKSNTCSFGDRSFSHAGPRLWNSLPMDIRSCKSVDSFKVSLKTYLFKQQYE
jgi:hypothetical protein